MVSIAGFYSYTGSPHIPYGRRALDAALDQLYGIYRTSAVVWICQDWEDWNSMATVYKKEEQWPQVFNFLHSLYPSLPPSISFLVQALECSLKALAHGSDATTGRDSIVHIFHTYLQ